jgi:hypothetical protein
MFKPIILIAFAAFILFYTNSFAQDQDILTIGEAKASKRDTKTINIISLDGKNRKVHIMPDYARRILRVSYLKDTISIEGYWGDPAKVHIFDNRFVQIIYDVRGGSNLALGNMLIVCVNGNRLYEALHILRYANWDSGDLMKYKVKVVFQKTFKKTYQLNVSVHDYVNLQTNPAGNYVYNDNNILRFDKKTNVFYNLKSRVYDTLKVLEPNTGPFVKQLIQGNFPTILLGEESYYYIKDGWYEVQRDHNIVRLASHSTSSR